MVKKPVDFSLHYHRLHFKLNSAVPMGYLECLLPVDPVWYASSKRDSEVNRAVNLVIKFVLHVRRFGHIFRRPIINSVLNSFVTK